VAIEEEEEMYTEKREEAGYVEEIRRRALKISQKCG
jgi:hypothetical protein